MHPFRQIRPSLLFRYVFLAVLAGAAAILGILQLPQLFGAILRLLRKIRPVVWGIGFAYVLSRPVRRIQGLLQRGGKGSKRGAAVALVCGLFAAGAGGLCALVLPLLWGSLQTLLSDLPGLLQTLEEKLAALPGALPDGLQQTAEGLIPGLISDGLPKLLPDLAGLGVRLTAGVLGTASDVALTAAVCIYALLSLDTLIAQCKKLLYALLPTEAAEKGIALTRQSNAIFGAYVSHVLLEALCIGLLHLGVLLALRVPYAPLLAAMAAAADLIPFLGPLLGGAVSVILLLVAAPGHVLKFLIATVCIQQAEAHLLAPRILGGATGLSKFWVVVALLLGGALFGLPGTMLGIPLFAAIWSVLRQWVHMRLQQRGLSVRTADYHTEYPPEGSP